MFLNSRIIILNSTKVGDSNLVVHSLSPSLGRRNYIIKAGRQGLALYQPLSVLDAEIIENPKSDLWRLKDVSAVYPLSGLRTNPGKSAISMFMAEVLYRTIRDSAEPGLFEWCEKSILTLDALPGSFSNFHLRWLLELCSALGFTPSLSDLASFAGEHLPSIEALMGPYDGALLLPLNGRSRSEIADSLLQYLAVHLESQINIRSLAVLSELFK